MRKSRGGLVLVLLLLLGLSAPASAHWADMAAAEVTPEGTGLRMVLTLPTGLVAGADGDGDGVLSPGEVEAHRADLERLLGEAVVATAGGAPGKLQVQPSGLAGVGGRSHSTLVLTWIWPEPPTGIHLAYRLFHPGAPEAHCLVTVLGSDGTVESHVLRPDRPDLQLGEKDAAAEALEFMGLGVHHLVTGYDHVLFLLALLLAGGGLRYLVTTITAFTLAHSITLTLAVLDLVPASPPVVEPLIALSIVYAAAENFWRKDLGDRWIVAFLFGLVHGLGFAGILREAALTGGNLALPLASFNVGVELGQLALVVPAWLALRAVLRDQERGRRFTLAASAGVALVGLYWFLERVGLLA